MAESFHHRLKPLLTIFWWKTYRLVNFIVPIRTPSFPEGVNPGRRSSSIKSERAEQHLRHWRTPTRSARANMSLHDRIRLNFVITQVSCTTAAKSCSFNTSDETRTDLEDKQHICIIQEFLLTIIDVLNRTFQRSFGSAKEKNQPSIYNQTSDGSLEMKTHPDQRILFISSTGSETWFTLILSEMTSLLSDPIAALTWRAARRVSFLPPAWNDTKQALIKKRIKRWGRRRKLKLTRQLGAKDKLCSSRCNLLNYAVITVSDTIKPINSFGLTSTWASWDSEIK